MTGSKLLVDERVILKINLQEICCHGNAVGGFLALWDIYDVCVVTVSMVS
jgi:hypothetical protein